MKLESSRKLTAQKGLESAQRNVESAVLAVFSEIESSFVSVLFLSIENNE